MDQGEVFARITDMRDAAGALRKSAARIRDAIDAVDQDVRALTPDRFTSPGAEVFRAEYQRLTPQLREAFEQLITFQEKLNISADDIEAAARTLR